MKTRAFIFFIIAICAIFFAPGFSNAQTITIGAISDSRFCTGDSVSVGFTATGFFGHKNAFTLQLSDSGGNFSNAFRNLGSVMDTLPGTFTISAMIPTDLFYSAHYRFRILAAIPYILSSDNGKDISIGLKPLSISIEQGEPNWPRFVGLSTSLSVNISGPVDSIYADFGVDANPRFLAAASGNSPTMYSTYSSVGDKTIFVRAGNSNCSLSRSYTIHVFDCSSPVIPHYAKVIDSNIFFGGGNQVFWVNPGVTANFNGSYQDTIFAEAGASIIGGQNSIVYLKPGASYQGISRGENGLIYAAGSSRTSADWDYKYPCPDLSFDYSKAPPNVAHPLSVSADINLKSITLSPNPTKGILTIHGITSNDLNVSVYTILGKSVMEFKNLHSLDFTLDLSKLVPGTYYIRFSSVNSVITKKIIKN